MIAGIMAGFMFLAAISVGLMMLYVITSADIGYGDKWLGVSHKGLRRRAAKRRYEEERHRIKEGSF